MKRTSLLLLTSCLMAAGVSAKPQVLQPKGCNRYVASVLTCVDDTTTYFLTDYFPTEDPTTSATFHAAATAPLSLLPIQGQTLVVERPLKEGYDRLYTLGLEKGKLQIGFTHRPTRVIALWQNTPLDAKCICIGKRCITISLPSFPATPERSYLRVYAADETSAYSDILLPLEKGQVILDSKQLTRHDAQSQVLYSLMIDRFRNGDSGNDWSYRQATGDTVTVLPQADYQGGDFKGITDEIRAGFFDSLGVSTIWVSPVTQNPYDVWGQFHNPETKFTGYHGYWPIFITAVEQRFGGEQALREMLRTAHEHKLNVILDYVANHMHKNAPLFQAHPDWATDSITPDGRRNFELWDEYRLTTWFDVHIPSLDLARQDICDQLTDSALFWVRNFDFDGYRHDACKHIPLNYWRMFTHKMMNDPQLQQRSLWMIGETYGNPALIGSYVKSGMLNAQFDFNIYHTAIDILGERPGAERSMQDLERVVEQSGAAYGAHHTMGNISGNHDKARFISLAGGDLSWDENDKAAGWNRHVGVGDSVKGYAKSLLLETLNLTLPGVPCIYQGDEYGQEGANDPDNRRMMRFTGYNHFEQAYRQRVEQLIRLRRSSMPLMYGDYLPLFCDKDVMVFARIYLGQAVVVGLNNGHEDREVQVTLPQGISSALGQGQVKFTIPANGGFVQ